MEQNKVTRTQAIQRMLLAMSPEHSQDLVKLYSFGMECQVNVAQDGGTRINGDYNGVRWNGFTDGLQTWKSFRIPYDAKSEAHYDDPPMNFDITKYTEGIGLTGWNWQTKTSKYVAFDFDSITNHKAGISDEELNAVVKAATEIPWVTIRKSTSGKGLHIYVFLRDVPTATHTEHAALARAILGKMSSTAGFDFAGHVDVCGGNIWVWHRKQKGTDGLSLVKSGVPLSDLPPNWKDHIEVVKGNRKKVKPSLLSDSESEKVPPVDFFEELSGQHVQVPLETGHKKLMEHLENEMTVAWWDADHHMLVCHTCDLQKAHETLKLKGIFKTNSSHSTPHNCFLFPMRNGQWSVRRYGLGVQEHESWQQDPQGWTRCYLNREPDLETAARTLKGVENSKGAYVFQLDGGTAVQKVVETLGAKIDIPDYARQAEASIKPHKQKNKLVVEIVANNHGCPVGFLLEKGKWVKVINLPNSQSEVEIDNSYDDKLRHIVSIDGSDAGWIAMTEKGWVNEPLAHIKHLLESQSYNTFDIKNMLGTAITKCWALVNKPFQPEYPGNREWNKDAAQLRFPISQKDPEKLHFPTWQKILTHLGASLTEDVLKNAWAQRAGLISGADYLKVWIASMFKKPNEQLPYLFLFGPQNCGKSMLHESLELLMKGGCCRADNALTNQQGFNYELANKVLCVVEEVDLHKAGTTAYNRIKDWVTSRNIAIHQKNGTPFMSRNTSHWIQCANDATACPIFPGDTRITAIEVFAIPQSDYVVRTEFIQRLEDEASDFLASILNLELPMSNDRLNLPVIATEGKQRIIESNRTQVEMFFEEKMFYCPGNTCVFAEVYDLFHSWLEPERRLAYSKQKFGKEIRQPFVKGRCPMTNQVLIGNASFSQPSELQLKQPPNIVVDGKCGLSIKKEEVK